MSRYSISSLLFDDGDSGTNLAISRLMSASIWYTRCVFSASSAISMVIVEYFGPASIARMRNACVLSELEYAFFPNACAFSRSSVSVRADQSGSLYTVLPPFSERLFFFDPGEECSTDSSLFIAQRRASKDKPAGSNQPEPETHVSLMRCDEGS